MSTEQHAAITEQILGAWDEVVEEEGASEAEPESEVEVPAGEETEPETVTEEVEQPVEPEPEEGEEEEAPEEGEEQAEGEEGEETEEEPEVEAVSDDPLVQAYLAKYGGDMQRAITAAANLEKVFGRQGLEMGALAQRVQQLEGELAQANAFQTAKPFLNAEQSEWVSEAAMSENPPAYIRQALDEGQFVLARAVCDEWAGEAPYEAIRASQIVDQAEAQYYQAVNAQQAPTLPRGELMEVLVQSYPDMPSYEQQMISTLNVLGDDHPTVIDSRSDDPFVAGRALVNLYEIARASSVSVSGAREQVRQQQRDAGNGARAAAQVSSSQASPSSGETPRRPKAVMPGLNLDELDEAFERY